MAYTNSDVSHAWAHNEHRAYYGNSMYHEHGVLKSYNTCIGQRIEINGKVVFIVDNTRYSTTTSKHQGCILSAIPSTLPNVEVFYFPRGCYNRSYFVYPWDSGELRIADWTRIGLSMLIADFEHCIEIKQLTKCQCNFSKEGYNQMLRLFKVTGVTNVNKLLRMKADDFSRLVASASRKSFCDTTAVAAVKHLRKFLRLMMEDAPIEKIVDAVNGKGTWQEYRDRTAYLRAMEKNRRLSDFVGYESPRGRCFRTYAGNCIACVSGSIRKKDIDKHTKAGDLISWLYKIRKENIDAAANVQLRYETNKRKGEAKARLERYIGMCGFSTGRSYWLSERPSFNSYNYNGTVIDFTGDHGYKERHLNGFEYAEYVNCKDKTEWIRNKKQWVLEQLLADQRYFEEYNARMAEEKRIYELECERYRKMETEEQEYIQELKAQGDEGLRQLYHEGFRISLPYGNSDLYFGGNVLLKVNDIRRTVETSKGIKLTFDECRRLWTIFKRWHEKYDEVQKGLLIQSISSKYQVHSFQNDILTAGCHQIAFSEMAYIAKTLGFES